MRASRSKLRWKSLSLTKFEYEQEYANALEHFNQLGHQIGNPYRSQGVRLVRVDKFSWTDDAVFEEVWGISPYPKQFDRHLPPACGGRRVVWLLSSSGLTSASSSSAHSSEGPAYARAP